jgi:hypothetical protein
MKKRFFQFFRRKYAPVRSDRVSPFSGKSGSQHLFLASLRGVSDQPRIVVIPLSFGQTGLASFSGGPFHEWPL